MNKDEVKYMPITRKDCLIAAMVFTCRIIDLEAVYMQEDNLEKREYLKDKIKELEDVRQKFRDARDSFNLY